MGASGDSNDFDVLGLLVQRWRTVGVFGAIGLAIAIAYAFAVSPWYSSRLTVVPSTQSRESAALSLVSKLPGLDPVMPDSKRIVVVFQSESVMDAVIDKFDLGQRYGTSYREDTRQVLGGHCVADLDKLSGVVGLTCEDTDPQMAKDMATTYGEVGNLAFARISTSSAGEEARFLEKQVAGARRDVDDASRVLREFQEQHKIIDLPEQSKAVISAMASIKGELLSKQLQLSYLDNFSAHTEANVVQLQEQIGILQDKIDELENAQHGAGSASRSGSGAGSAADFFPGAMNVPELRFQLEQLLRDQKIKETVFSLMTQRYEIAKADAARDTSQFQILDHPSLPTKKSRPVRRKIAMIGGLAGGAAGAIWILAPIWWRRRMVVRTAL